MPDVVHIKKINIGGTEFPIDADTLSGHSYQDILDEIAGRQFHTEMSWSEYQYQRNTAPTASDLAKIPNVVKPRWDNGNKPSQPAEEVAGTLDPDDADTDAVYLVCVGGAAHTVFD